MAFVAQPIEQAMLGPSKDVPVKVLQKNDPLLSLHNNLLALAENGSFIFNTPEFVGEGFLPHATDQKDGQLQIGKTCSIASISLVDMFPGGDHMRRKILKTFPFDSQRYYRVRISQDLLGEKG